MRINGEGANVIELYSDSWDENSTMVEFYGYSYTEDPVNYKSASVYNWIHVTN